MLPIHDGGGRPPVMPPVSRVTRGTATRPAVTPAPRPLPTSQPVAPGPTGTAPAVAPTATPVVDPTPSLFPLYTAATPTPACLALAPSPAPEPTPAPLFTPEPLAPRVTPLTGQSPSFPLFCAPAVRPVAPGEPGFIGPVALPPAALASTADSRAAAATRTETAVSAYVDAKTTWTKLTSQPGARYAMQIDDVGSGADYRTVVDARSEVRDAMAAQFVAVARDPANAQATDPAADPYQRLAEDLAASQVPPAARDDYLSLIDEARAEAMAATPATPAEARAQTLADVGDVQQARAAIEAAVVDRVHADKAAQPAIDDQIAALSQVEQDALHRLGDSLADERRLAQPPGMPAAGASPPAAWAQSVRDLKLSPELRAIVLVQAGIDQPARSDGNGTISGAVISGQASGELATGSEGGLPSLDDDFRVQQALASGDVTALRKAVDGWNATEGFRGPQQDDAVTRTERLAMFDRLKATNTTIQSLNERIDFVMATRKLSADTAFNDPEFALLMFQRDALSTDFTEGYQALGETYAEPADAQAWEDFTAFLAWNRGLAQARYDEALAGGSPEELSAAEDALALADQVHGFAANESELAGARDAYGKLTEAAAQAAKDQRTPDPTEFRRSPYSAGSYNADTGERDWNPIAGKSPDPGDPDAAITIASDGDDGWTVTTTDSIRVEVQPRAQYAGYGQPDPEGTKWVDVTDIRVEEVGDDGRYRVEYKVQGQEFWSWMDKTDAAVWDAHGQYRDDVETHQDKVTALSAGIDVDRAELREQAASVMPHGALAPDGGPQLAINARNRAAGAVLAAEQRVFADPDDAEARQALLEARGRYATVQAEVTRDQHQADVESLQTQLTAARGDAYSDFRRKHPNVPFQDADVTSPEVTQLEAALEKAEKARDEATINESVTAANLVQIIEPTLEHDGSEYQQFQANAEVLARPLIEQFYASGAPGTETHVVTSESSTRDYVTTVFFDQQAYDELSDDDREFVDKVAGQIQDTAGEGGQARAMPVVYASESNGMSMQLVFSVSDGKDDFLVDLDGSRFDSEQDYRENNRTMVAEGEVMSVLPAHEKPVFGDDGHIELSVGDARIESGWESFKREWHVDLVIAGVGTVAAVVLAVGSAGTATPISAGIMAAAWGVTGATMAYGAYTAVDGLADAGQHGRSLSLTDSEARMNWLTLAASVLPMPSALRSGSIWKGTITADRAAIAADRTALTDIQRTAVRTEARAAVRSGPEGLAGTAMTVANSGAAVTGTAGLVEGTVQTLANWEQMSPGQRTEALAMIAFNGIGATAGGVEMIGHRHQPAPTESPSALAAAAEPPALPAGPERLALPAAPERPALTAGPGVEASTGPVADSNPLLVGRLSDVHPSDVHFHGGSGRNGYDPGTREGAEGLLRLIDGGRWKVAV